MKRQSPEIHRRQRRRPERRSGGLLPWQVVVPGVVAVLLFSLAVSNGAPGGPNASGTPTPRLAESADQAYPPIAGIECSDAREPGYQVQAMLIVRVDGERVVIPGGIGKRTRCQYWVHTERSLGVIHVDAPQRRVFTIGDFFDIWLQPLDGSRVGQYSVGPGDEIFSFVNGQAWPNEPRVIPLDDGSIVEIQIGPTSRDPLQLAFPRE